ncbi:MAG: hypothetical protein ABFS41_05930 [Myxococcota bacterium]
MRLPAEQESRPPAWFWGIPLLAGGLRMLPFLAQRFVEPPPGTAWLPVSYLPKDFLQYAAFSRQVVVDGSFFFYNPFTTEPQADRFVLAFHWAVGLVAKACGAAPFTAFEWSRIPLLFAFFAALWWFLRPALPDRRERGMAALLVGFAGGLEGFVRPFAEGWLPPGGTLRLLQDTSPLHGWSPFAGFYNPLWIAALTLALLVLRPLLFERERSPGRLAACAAGLVGLFFVHPYTALGVGVIATLHPLVARLCGENPPVRRWLEDLAVLGAAALVAGSVSLWQLQDAVYRQGTGGVLGDQNLSVLWYPLTLGLLGAMAWVGARRVRAARESAHPALFAWIGAVAALHWLPFLNGYKFVFLLPLPLCILAAPVACDWLGSRLASGWRGRALAVLAGVALFAGSALQTATAVRSVGEVSAAPVDLMGMVELLADEPTGNALVPSGLGNVLPAFSAHRVWVGHWFLTPDFFEREALLHRLTTQPRMGPQLVRLLEEQAIRYIVVPRARADFVARQLGASVAERRRVGGLELLVVEPGQGT